VIRAVHQEKNRRMIARIWRGRVRPHDAEIYLEYLHRTGVADYEATPGNLGVTILQREIDGAVEFTILTLWASMEAIRAFAGDNPEVSHYYAEDEAYLLHLEPYVEHFDVPYSNLPLARSGA
jgi:heme-degrading monooxygenase HmoA